MYSAYFKGWIEALVDGEKKNTRRNSSSCLTKSQKDRRPKSTILFFMCSCKHASELLDVMYGFQPTDIRLSDLVSGGELSKKDCQKAKTFDSLISVIVLLNG